MTDSSASGEARLPLEQLSIEAEQAAEHLFGVFPNAVITAHRGLGGQD